MGSPPRKRLPDGRDDAGRWLLVLAQPSDEIEGLLAGLVGRRDLHVIRVVTMEAAALALRDLEISVVLTCPETSVQAVDVLLGHIDRLRPGIPLLAVRDRDGDESPAWKTRAVGVLRSPLSSDVLSRSIDVAFGLSDRRDDD